MHVLDANVFIEAARRYYAFDLAPRFWQSLSSCVLQGHIQSIDRVKKELLQLQDDLSGWVQDGGFGNGFVPTDTDDVVQIYRDIIGWVYGQPQFLPGAKTGFASGADGWLIVYAKTRECIIVTQEVLARDAKRTVPIPNVCQAFAVPYVDTFGMLRALGITFP